MAEGSLTDNGSQGQDMGLSVPRPGTGVLTNCDCDEAERNRKRGREGDRRYVSDPVWVDEDGGRTCSFCWTLLP